MRARTFWRKFATIAADFTQEVPQIGIRNVNKAKRIIERARKRQDRVAAKARREWEKTYASGKEVVQEIILDTPEQVIQAAHEFVSLAQEFMALAEEFKTLESDEKVTFRQCEIDEANQPGVIYGPNPQTSNFEKVYGNVVDYVEASDSDFHNPRNLTEADVKNVVEIMRDTYNMPAGGTYVVPESELQGLIDTAQGEWDTQEPDNRTPVDLCNEHIPGFKEAGDFFTQFKAAVEGATRDTLRKAVSAIGLRGFRNAKREELEDAIWDCSPEQQGEILTFLNQ